MSEGEENMSDWIRQLIITKIFNGSLEGYEYNVVREASNEIRAKLESKKEPEILALPNTVEPANELESFTKTDLINLVQSLKDYTLESGNILGYDDRDAEQFVDEYIHRKT